VHVLAFDNALPNTNEQLDRFVDWSRERTELMNQGTFSQNGKQLPVARSIAGQLPNIPGLGGAIAGIGGGLAMIIVAALLSIAIGHDVWREPREIAMPLFGAAAQSGWAPIVVGTVIHFIIAALFGAIFGIVSRRLLGLPSDYGAQVLAGLIYGMALWVLAYFIILPIVNPALLDTYAPSFLIQHLVYGVVAGLIYAQLRPAPYAYTELDRTRPAMAER
jgi:hypothetical protein